MLSCHFSERKPPLLCSNLICAVLSLIKYLLTYLDLGRDLDSFLVVSGLLIKVD